MDGEIDPDELVELLDENGDDRDLRIVDIRDRRAFDRGHLPESDCIPFPELTTRVRSGVGRSRTIARYQFTIASKAPSRFHARR